MFNIVAIKDDVSGESLPDHSTITVEEIKVADFLPSARDRSPQKRFHSNLDTCIGHAVRKVQFVQACSRMAHST